MSNRSTDPVRLTPELQAEYQQIYNDPTKVRSDAWYIAAKGLFAAGLITSDPGAPADMTETLGIADTRTAEQSL